MTRRKLNLLFGSNSENDSKNLSESWTAHHCKVKMVFALVCNVRAYYLQKVTSAPSHHSSPFSLKPIDHDHQVNMGVLLLDGAVPPGTLHFVVCILPGEHIGDYWRECKEQSKQHSYHSLKQVTRVLLLFTTINYRWYQSTLQPMHVMMYDKRFF